MRHSLLVDVNDVIANWNRFTDEKRKNLFKTVGGTHAELEGKVISSLIGLVSPYLTNFDGATPTNAFATLPKRANDLG